MKDLESLPKLYIRGTISPRGSLVESLGGESFSASDARDFLIENKEAPEIVVEISSDGGYKTEGVEIFNVLKNSGKKITTIAYKANSIATVIMLAGHTRLIVEHAQFVVHFARIDPINLGLDSLTAEDFQALADEVDRTDREIVDIYCSVLGEENRSTLIEAMRDERDLGSKGAMKLGFATGFYKKAKKEKVTQDVFQNVLITDHMALLIENKMSKETEQKSLEKFIMDKFKGLARKLAGIKNEVTLPLQAGGAVYVVPADPAAPEVLEQGQVYLVDEAGLPTETPAPDGEHPLEDGRILIVEGGLVKSVTPVEDKKKEEEEKLALISANEALKKESEELKAQLETVKAQSVADKSEMKKEMDAISNAFNEFKKIVPGDKGDKKDEPVDPKDKNKKFSINEIRNKLEQSKIK